MHYGAKAYAATAELRKNFDVAVSMGLQQVHQSIKVLADVRVAQLWNLVMLAVLRGVVVDASHLDADQHQSAHTACSTIAGMNTFARGAEYS